MILLHLKIYNDNEVTLLKLFADRLLLLFADPTNKKRQPGSWGGKGLWKRTRSLKQKPK